MNFIDQHVKTKTPDQIEKMRIASRLTASALEMIGPHVKVGVSTEELDAICHDFIVNQCHATPGSLNYHGFPKSVCTSVNHQVCHGIPGPRKLKDGDCVNIDIVVMKDNFFGDSSKMFIVGKPSVIVQRLVQVTQECLYLGIGVVKPGLHVGDIGEIIQRHAEKNNFSVVREFCGHGISNQMHEPPNILHYGEAGTGEILEEGMTFTIEPMINAGKRHIKILPDGWTAVTKDHMPSAQWEHTLLVTKNGCEILTLRPEENLDAIMNIRKTLGYE